MGQQGYGEQRMQGYGGGPQQARCKHTGRRSGAMLKRSCMHSQLHVAQHTPSAKRRRRLGAASHAARPARQGYMGQQGYGEPRMQGYGGGPMEVRRMPAAHRAPAAVLAAGAVHARHAAQAHGVLPCAQLRMQSSFKSVSSGSKSVAQDAGAHGAAKEQLSQRT
jgi:hypothetical protein